MGIFDWISKNKNKVASAASKGGPITVEKALNFSKAYEELKPFFALFVHYFKFLLDSEEKIVAQIKDIQSKTKQNLIEEQLLRELRALRYVSSHIWFFNLRPPKNQEDLGDGLLTIESALKSALKDRNKLDYLPWLKKELAEYSNSNELNFKNFKSFKNNYSERLSEKITRIPFDVTGGRLGGELHDFVVELLMTTIMQDKKVFLLDSDAVSADEIRDIKNAIGELATDRKKAAKNFFGM
jgi:hypothetical protein